MISERSGCSGFLTLRRLIQKLKAIELRIQRTKLIVVYSESNDQLIKTTLVLSHKASHFFLDVLTPGK